jgi:DNA-binding PadR family transcriptional regulator
MTGSLRGEASVYFARRRAPAGRSGRARKVYGITDQGREVLVTLLEDPAADDKAFPLKLALCAALVPERRLELFERRRGALAVQLATTRSGRRRSSERVDRYLRSLREHDTQTLENEIAWLDGLIAAEREQLRADGPVTSQEDTTE